MAYDHAHRKPRLGRRRLAPHELQHYHGEGADQGRPADPQVRRFRMLHRSPYRTSIRQLHFRRLIGILFTKETKPMLQSIKEFWNAIELFVWCAAAGALVHLVGGFLWGAVFGF